MAGLSEPQEEQLSAFMEATVHVAVGFLRKAREAGVYAETAKSLASFRDELIANGFSREEAITLLPALQAAVVPPKN
jgi:uncharacterized protein YehS (DUF1456 family)